MIFAWTGALAKRGELDDTPELTAFAKAIEKACIDTIGDGTVTGDLAPLCGKKASDTLTFLKAVRKHVEI